MPSVLDLLDAPERQPTVEYTLTLPAKLAERVWRGAMEHRMSPASYVRYLLARNHGQLSLLGAPIPEDVPPMPYGPVVQVELRVSPLERSAVMRRTRGRPIDTYMRGVLATALDPETLPSLPKLPN
jgi:hypothetical protein